MASKSKKGDHKSHQKPTIQAKNTSSAAGQQYKPGKQASIPTSNLTGTSKNKNNKSAKTMVPSGLDFIDHVDRFLTKRHTFFFFLSIGLAILFSVLLFDFKVGPGGDDSAYLMRSFDFVHGFVYPGYQGPLYPVILSPFIWMFGIQLTLLKILSLIFMIIALNFFYKTFYNRIPATILTISFLL